MSREKEFGYGYWISPQGEIFDISNESFDNLHYLWIERKLGLLDKGLEDYQILRYAFKQGWIQAGYMPSDGSIWIHSKSLDNIDKFINYIYQNVNHNVSTITIFAYGEGNNRIDIRFKDYAENNFNLQKTIYQQKRVGKYKKLMSILNKYLNIS